ncbi:MAG: sigma-54-dependent Fis family transcriptional regulator [FCB group bacterium]|nr:sigma-54-dependent Fis family transcriptional regulator [FCB group bacterium]
MASILIVEDDNTLRQVLINLLTGQGYRVSSAACGKEAESALKNDIFELVLTDLCLGDTSGLDILNASKRLHPETEVIIMTAFGSVKTAVEAMQNGAWDYITKPFKHDELLLKVSKALERIELRNEVRLLRQEVAHQFGFDNIIGNSKIITDLKKIAGRISNSDIAVLITGESGTGKELFAKVLHHHSARRKKGFVPINCSAIPESLLESELFGHIKGAFTSAVTNRRGLFEEAEGGTLFLDEIGDLPYSTQAKLLRVLQEKEIRPVGGNSTRSIDVRIIAATNSDLGQKVENGQFREDLFYRLNVMPLHVPPLRERPEDIPLLAEYCLRKIRGEYGRNEVTLTADSVDMLLRHNWPGNVRELENTLKRALALSSGDSISREDIIFISPQRTKLTVEPAEPVSKRSLLENQKIQILKSLEANNWNYSMTADQLGIGRTTLWRKVRKFNLKQPEAV